MKKRRQDQNGEKPGMASQSLAEDSYHGRVVHGMLRIKATQQEESHGISGKKLPYERIL